MQGCPQSCELPRFACSTGSGLQTDGRRQCHGCRSWMGGILAGTRLVHSRVEPDCLPALRGPHRGGADHASAPRANRHVGTSRHGCRRADELNLPSSRHAAARGKQHLSQLAGCPTVDRTGFDTRFPALRIQLVDAALASARRPQEDWSASRNRFKKAGSPFRPSPGPPQCWFKVGVPNVHLLNAAGESSCRICRGPLVSVPRCAADILYRPVRGASTPCQANRLPAPSNPECPT